jgi:hypothetical protein
MDLKRAEAFTGSFRLWRIFLMAILAVTATRVYQQWTAKQGALAPRRQTRQETQAERDRREAEFIMTCNAGCPDGPDGRALPSCDQRCERLHQIAFPASGPMYDASVTGRR